MDRVDSSFGHLQPAPLPEGGWSRIKIINLVCLLVGGAGILAYPVIVLADVMSLAADSSGSPKMNPHQLVVWNMFVFGTLAYPVVYLPCLIADIVVWRKGGQRAAAAIGVLPIAYAAFLGLMLLLAIIINPQ